MNYEQLNESLQEQLNDSKFLKWILSGFDREMLGYIARMIDANITPMQLQKLDVKIIRNKMTNTHHRKKLIMLKIVPPFPQYFDDEKMAQLNEQLQTDEKETVQDETIAEMLDDNTLDEKEKAVIYFFQNEYEKALAIYEVASQVEGEKKKIVKKKKEVLELKRKVEENEENEKKIERKIQRIENERAQYQQEVNELKEQMKQLRQEQHKERQEWQHEVALERKQLEEQIEQLEQKNEALRIQVTQLQKEIEENKKQVVVSVPEQERPTEHMSTDRWRNYAWEGFAIGRLADHGKTENHAPIFINKSGVLQFWIECLSFPSNDYPHSEKIVTSWVNYLEDVGFYETEVEDSARMEALRTFLADRLLVFRIHSQDGHFSARDIDVLPKRETFVGNETFLPIPLFSQERKKYNTIDAFAQTIQRHEFIGQNDAVSHATEDMHPLVFFKDAAQSLYAVGLFDSFHYAHGGFRFDEIQENTVRYAPLPKKWIDDMYVYDGVAFVETRHFERLVEELKTKAEKRQVEVEEELALHVIEPSVIDETLLEEEASFLRRWIKDTKQLQLSYRTEDLHNFHTCMKSGGLTILAGMSGTGKSRLVQTYQKSLGLQEEQFLFIPVSPTWTDEADILGYVDAIHDQYRPAATGLVDLLCEAERHPHRSYIVCFDEMNLARIEHYFSPFLSLLEREEEHRRLALYNPALQLKNRKQYPPSISIGSNVFFTGTVNLDESTQMLSDKVLDRANVMMLHVEPFRNLLDGMSSEEPSLLSPPKPVAIQSFIREESIIQLYPRELDFLWDVHQLLSSETIHGGIGPRIVERIDRYMRNAFTALESGLKRDRAFDLQFVQRIASKIRGTEELLRPIVGTYDETEGVVTESALIELFDTYSDLSLFTTSRIVIAEKAKELSRNGYAF